MKKDRNCGMNMPYYPNMPMMTPNYMNMMPNMGVMNVPNMNMDNMNLGMNDSMEIASLNNKISNLERRVSNLESMIGNNSNYNSTGYQMM